MNDGEFYIGWEDRAPAGLGRRVSRLVIVLLGAAVVLAGLLAVGQRTIGESVFEWGTVKDFSGVLRATPYPHLLVSRPGLTGPGAAAHSSYHLVKPFKFGLEPELTGPLDGKKVRLKGTLIYRGSETMIEVAEGTLQPAPESGSEVSTAGPAAESLGWQTLVGEIVDSKCYLGVMNPGVLLPHRACAIRCISGGIPPILLVRQAHGPPLNFLLVSAAGQPVNKEVLDRVAEPVEVAGMVERQGDLLILRADPSTYRRVGRNP